jgi:glycosyltransferase involved in cell wall biosynthesis
VPTNTPLVSIIIPTFNRAHLIGETLDSVLAQTYQNWECIVVDDGSTDDTSEVMSGYIASDKRFQYFHRPENKLKGANACRNQGFYKSRGDFLIFLDSDDLLEISCLETRCANENEKNNKDNSICVYSMGVFQFGIKTDKIFNKKFNTEKESIEYFLKVSPPWQTTSLFWPRALFVKTKMFDEEFERLQDVDIHTRLLLNGIKVNSVEIVDCWYRILDNPKEYVSEEKRPMLVQSHVQFIKKFYNYEDSELLNSFEINDCLRITYLKVLKKYVFRENIFFFNKVNTLNKTFGILSFNKSRMIELLAFYHNLGISNKYGYTKLRNLIFNK